MSCHSHGHSHGGHDHAGHSHSTANRKRLLLTLILAAGYMVAEVVGGLISNSLALLADAGHMFSDVASLALSVFARSGCFQISPGSGGSPSIENFLMEAG